MPSASASASAPKTRSEPVRRRPARKSVTATVRASPLFSWATYGFFRTGEESAALGIFERPPSPLVPLPFCSSHLSSILIEAFTFSKPMMFGRGEGLLMMLGF